MEKWDFMKKEVMMGSRSRRQIPPVVVLGHAAAVSGIGKGRNAEKRR
jgi:hypothetical protein